MRITVHTIFELFTQILEIVLRIFASIPLTTATSERSFTYQDLYLRATMGQERLSDLTILSIKKEIANKTDFSVIIHDFAVQKSRKN